LSLITIQLQATIIQSVVHKSVAYSEMGPPKATKARWGFHGLRKVLVQIGFKYTIPSVIRHVKTRKSAPGDARILEYTCNYTHKSQ